VDKSALEQAAAKAGLSPALCSWFLFGANQLFVLEMR